MYIYCREVEINVIHGDENILTKVFKNGKSDNPNDRDTKGHIKKGLTKMPGWEKAEVGDVKDLLTLQVPAWGIKQLEDMISKDIFEKNDKFGNTIETIKYTSATKNKEDKLISSLKKHEKAFIAMSKTPDSCENGIEFGLLLSKIKTECGVEKEVEKKSNDINTVPTAMIEIQQDKFFGITINDDKTKITVPGNFYENGKSRSYKVENSKENGKRIKIPEELGLLLFNDASFSRWTKMYAVMDEKFNLPKRELI